MGGGGGRVARVVAGVVVAILVVVSAATTASVASAAPVESITRVASGIEQPTGIVQGPDGNLWFTSTGNDAIGRSTPTGSVTFFTGIGIDRPGAIVVGPDGALWFTNVGNGSVGRISTAGAVTNFQVPDLVQLGGIATGADGNIWVSESTFDTLVRITPAGAMTAFPSGVTSPGGLVAGPDGNLWFTSTDDDTIVTMTVAGVTTEHTGVAIDGPTAITVGPDGNLWFGGLDGSIGRITPSGTASSFPTGSSEAVVAIASGADGNLWSASAGPAIRTMTTAGVVTTYDRPATVVRAVTPGPGGNVWFAEDHVIGSITPQGTATTFVGSGLAVPRSISWGPDGNMWFTNRATDSIGRVTPGGAVTSYTSPAVDSPEQIAAGPDDSLWFTNLEGGTIGRITTAGAITTFPVPGGATPVGIVQGPDNNLWFTVPEAGSIGQITTSGVVTMFTGGGMQAPSDIANGHDGNLWFTDPATDRIGRLTPIGNVMTFAAPGKIANPSSITAGPDGNLWFVNEIGSVGRITTSGSVTSFPDADLASGGSITSGPDGALWYSRYGNDSVGRITIDGTVTNVLGPDIGARPVDIAVGPDLNLWVASETSTIAKITLTRTTPDAPRAVVATAGFAQATVSWSRPLYTGGTPIVAYHVTSSSGHQCAVAEPDRSCTFTGLTNGTEYTFSVRALNSSGYGPFASAAPVTPFVGATFHPVTPTRLLDSRGPNGGWDGTVTSAAPRSLQVGGRAGVPLTATAAVLNVTVTDSDSSSFLTVFPAGSPKPTTSNLNFDAGEIVPNLVTVKLGVGGKVDIATAIGQTHVVADLVGFYDDGSGGAGRFNPITPTRLLDSRGSTGGWPGRLTAGAPRDLAVRSPQNPQGVPSTATAIVANVTVTESDSQSFLAAWPSGVPQPNVSNLNFLPGQTVPNLVTVGIGANGAVRFANTIGSVHVIVDVVGYYDPTAGARFHPMTPSRILDTRFDIGIRGPSQPKQERIFGVAGFPGTGVPRDANGLVANVTVTDPTAESLLSLYPGDVPRPNSSNLNFGAGQIVPNLVAVGLSPQGTVGIYNDAGTVHVIADAVGFFVP